jgi:Leucine-rich repeat (LRR) protein
MPKVIRLDLSHNKITEIKHLQWLSHMTYLDMSYNDIEELEALHSKLGNLKTLNLAGNRLHSLQGSHMTSLI